MQHRISLQIVGDRPQVKIANSAVAARQQLLDDLYDYWFVPGSPGGSTYDNSKDADDGTNEEAFRQLKAVADLNPSFDEPLSFCYVEPNIMTISIQPMRPKTELDMPEIVTPFDRETVAKAVELGATFEGLDDAEICALSHLVVATHHLKDYAFYVDGGLTDANFQRVLDATRVALSGFLE